MEKDGNFWGNLSAETRVYQRGHSDFEPHVYQYAKSSRYGMDPSVIVYPKNVKEILDIVDYAKEKKFGIAVRTGGHQYSGMIWNYNLSSTSRP